MRIKLEVSARHIHLSQDDFVLLFGNKILTKRNDLSQKGEFAANQSVEVVGSEGRITKVRVVGPFRQRSQLELSRTDCYRLGIDAPVAISGSGKGASVKVVGPKGFFIKDIAMIPLRHMHLAESAANKYKVTEKTTFSIKINSERPTVFYQVKVRISPDYCNTVHIDTDEANASSAKNGMIVIAEKE